MATLAHIHKFPTVIPLIVANSVPIAGVLFLGWDLRSIMFVYWLETAVVVFYSLVKIVVVGGWLTLLSVPLNVAAFGVFMTFHLMMILALGPRPGIDFFPPALIKDLVHRTWGAALGLVVSHGISLCTNFLWNGEYRHTTVGAQVAAPWKRLIIMHVTTLAGAWSAMLFDAPVGALVILGVLKIVVDVHGHLRERPMQADAPPRTVTAGGTKTQGVLTLFGGFLVFCALVLALGTASQAYRASRVTTQWPTVEAHVDACRMGVTQHRRSDVRHSVRCRFRYDAGGAEHVATLTTRNTTSAATIAHMQTFVRRHWPGTIQPIHVNPSVPENISLGEFGAMIDPPQFAQTLAAAAAFAGVGGLLLLLARRLRAPG